MQLEQMSLQDVPYISLIQCSVIIEENASSILIPYERAEKDWGETTNTTPHAIK
jgi:hypothetical protein